MVNKVGGGRRIKILILTLLSYFSLALEATAGDMARIDDITLNITGTGTGIAVDGNYGYALTTGFLIKIDLSDMTLVGNSLPISSGNAIAVDGNYGYVATYSYPTKVIKIRLSDMVQVGTVVFASDENGALAIAVDGDYGYVTTNSSPARVVKFRLSTMTREKYIPCGESGYAIAIDGDYGYVTTNSSPAQVVKFRLSDMVKVNTITLNTGESNGRAIAIDGDYGYVTTDLSPARVVKIRLSDMVRLSYYQIPLSFEKARTIAIDGDYGYVASSSYPITFFKIHLSDMSYVASFKFNSGENLGEGLAISGNYAYVISGYDPPTVVKVKINTIKPSIPIGLTANTLSYDQIRLIWNCNTEPDLTGYIIYRDYDEIARVGSDQTSYDDGGLTPDTNYTYGIKAYTLDDESDMSNVATIKTSLPPAPADLTIRDITPTGAMAAWGAVEGAESYNIYLNNHDIYNTNETEYGLSDLVPGTNYTIEIRTVISGIESAPGACVKGFTTAESLPPTGLTVSNITTTGAMVTWNSVPGADSYNIYLDGSPIYNTALTEYGITGLKSGTKHTIEIRAVADGYESAPGKCKTTFQTVSVIGGPDAISMAGDVASSMSMIMYMYPLGGLLALGLGVKLTPWIIAAAKTLFLK